MSESRCATTTTVFDDMMAMSTGMCRSMLDLWGMSFRAAYWFVPMSGLRSSSISQTITLSGKTGARSSCCYTVENTSFQTVKVRVSVSALETSPTKNSGETQLGVEEPYELELGPWQKKNVTVAAKIANDLTEGEDYEAELQVWTETQRAKIVVRRTK